MRVALNTLDSKFKNSEGKKHIKSKKEYTLKIDSEIEEKTVSFFSIIQTIKSNKKNERLLHSFESTKNLTQSHQTLLIIVSTEKFVNKYQIYSIDSESNEEKKIYNNYGMHSSKQDKTI